MIDEDLKKELERYFTVAVNKYRIKRYKEFIINFLKLLSRQPSLMKEENLREWNEDLVGLFYEYTTLTDDEILNLIEAETEIIYLYSIRRNRVENVNGQ